MRRLEVDFGIDADLVGLDLLEHRVAVRVQRARLRLFVLPHAGETDALADIPLDARVVVLVLVGRIEVLGELGLVVAREDAPFRRERPAAPDRPAVGLVLREAAPLARYSVAQKRRSSRPSAEINKPTLGWHTLRRTYASLLLATGASLRVSMELMRHSTAEMTLATYAQAVGNEKRGAGERVACMVLPKGKAA